MKKIYKYIITIVLLLIGFNFDVKANTAGTFQPNYIDATFTYNGVSYGYSSYVSSTKWGNLTFEGFRANIPAGQERNGFEVTINNAPTGRQSVAFIIGISTTSNLGVEGTPFNYTISYNSIPCQTSNNTPAYYNSENNTSMSFYGVVCPLWDYTTTPYLTILQNAQNATGGVSINGVYINKYVHYDLASEVSTSTIEGELSAISSSISSLDSSIDSASSNITNAQEKTTEAVEDVNDTLKDSSIDSSQASDFFEDFDDNDHGLSGVVTAPLNFIRNLSSATCSPITLNIPFVNTSFNLPCFSSIYSQHFSTLFQTYRIITFGIVAYWVCIKIFGLVKGFRNPDDDRVEVLDL